jgi:hypothetical protein
MTGRQSLVFLAEAESEAPNRNPDASRTTPGPLIFVVSGEASGDNLAGSLMQALKAQGKNDDAALIEARFKKAWAHADVTLSASRFGR